MANRLHYCARCLTTFGEDGDVCPNLACGTGRPKDGWAGLLGAGDLLDRRYRILRPLAVGGAGLTYLAREVDADGNAIEPDLAIKVLYTSRAEGSFLRRLSNEAQILQELDHDNIVTCRGFVQRAGMEPYLVTLFENGGNLQTHIERVGSLTPRIAAGVLRQILLALDVAHQRGVVHRDLKPDNVLLREQTTGDMIPHIRLTDFGIAKISGGLSSQLTQHGSFVGTPEYAAPEQFQGHGATAATDVFAAGGLLLFLLTGKPPFHFEQRTDIAASFRQMLDGLPPQLDPKQVVGTVDEIIVLQEILDNTMIAKTDHRWTIHQIIAQLNRILKGEARPAEQRTLEITDQPAPDRLAEPPPQPILEPSSTSTFTVEETREEDRGRKLSPMAAPPKKLTPPPPEPPAAKPSPPAERPSEVPPAPEQPQPRGIGGLLFGGVAGIFMVFVVGGGLSLATLVAGAWLFGWMDGTKLPLASLDPVAVDLELAGELNGAVVLLGSRESGEVDARFAMTSALDKLAKKLGKDCKAKGNVAGTLLVKSNGGIGFVALDPGYVSSEKTACLREKILELQLPNDLDGPALLRTAFSVSK